MAKRWDPLEIELIETLSGQLTLKALARKLNRSENAVYLKQQRLGIGGYLKNSDMLAQNTVATMLGLDSKTLKRWENKGYIKSYHKGVYRMYKQDQLLKCLEEHQDIWNAKKVTDDTIFVNAEWFRKKRINDSDPHFFWSWEDKARVKQLRHEGYSISEIARMTGRTMNSITYFLYRADEKIRRKKNERIG